jgi:ribA/ribD-fused uncharacterized protein
VTIKFYKSVEPYGYLNNFRKAPMFIYCNWYKNVEAAYQSRKTNDPDEQKAIRLTPHPGTARDLGQNVTMRPDWDNIKYQVMAECVLAKFVQHRDLRERLLSTGQEHLIEDSPVDSWWGCGADGKGKNNLGRILMATRALLVGEDEVT